MTILSNNKAHIGDPTIVEGKCWRGHPQGYHGRAQAHIRKELCAAFYSMCQQCGLIGHYTRVCKKGNRVCKRANDRIGRDDMWNMYVCGGPYRIDPWPMPK